MNVIKTAIDGVLIIEPKVFGDKRGYFFESFSQREFDEKVAPILGHTVTFVQDNESKSSYGVMRGLHFQRPPYTQSKLVRCVKGAVLDVAVDIRKGSPTYGQHVECLLTGRDDEGIQPSDDQVLLQIKDATGAATSTAFQQLPDEVKRNVLKQLKDSGASHRQLERLTGVGRGLIQKL